MQDYEEVLRGMVGSPDYVDVDISHVLHTRELLPADQKAQVDLVFNARLFHDWNGSAFSQKLLVQWDDNEPTTIAGVSPLSVFCAHLMRNMETEPEFLTIVWFCGLHIDPVEPQTAVGGRAMVASLIDQLLRCHHSDMQKVRQEINTAFVQQGKIRELIKLLGWLIRRLPTDITLLCIIDGVVMFEREEFRRKALMVFSSLLTTCNDRAISSTLKVLFTSTPGTGLTRAAFEPQGLILDAGRLRAKALESLQ
ncbi:hypothetical protein SCUP515_08789 [Seiridium cupressi]